MQMELSLRFMHLSGVTLALGDVSLSGMTLAAIVGMIMSLVFYAFDKFHLSNDA